MNNIEVAQRLKTEVNIVGGAREMGQELLKRLPLINNEFSSAEVLNRLGRFAEWIRERTSLEERARLFVLLENTIKEDVLHIQFHLAAKGDKFKRIILDLIFSGNETRFTAYENKLYVAVPPKGRQEETASPTIVREFFGFLKEALEANPAQAIS